MASLLLQRRRITETSGNGSLLPPHQLPLEEEREDNPTLVKVITDSKTSGGLVGHPALVDEVGVGEGPLFEDPVGVRRNRLILWVHFRPEVPLQLLEEVLLGLRGPGEELSEDGDNLSEGLLALQGSDEPEDVPSAIGVANVELLAQTHPG